MLASSPSAAWCGVQAAPGLLCINFSFTDSPQPRIENEAQMTLLFAAYIGLSATLTIGFCSAMMVTAQEGDD